MQVEVLVAAPDQRAILANLLELYAHDFSEFHNLDLDETGRFGYSSLPLYWSEADRHPFLIRIDGKLAGLALVKKGSDLSGDRGVWDMAEFFIVRGSRGRGAGSHAARLVFARFPGLWEVRVMEKNRGARRFWAKAIATFVGEAIHPGRIEKGGATWEVFPFESRPLGPHNVPHDLRGHRMTKMLLLSAFLVSLIFVTAAVTQEKKPAPIALWPQGAPGALGNDSPGDQPRITPFPAPKMPGRETHTAILILPGGSYQDLATDHEGVQVAKWLNNLGVSAFMLEYRLGTKYHHPIELNDAKRGLRWVRSHAAEYGYDPNRVGVWGFSAGGHLASTLGTHFDAGDPVATDPIDRLGSRPDFMVLTYPVIAPLGPAAVHSFDQLLGKNADPALVEEVTNDRHVTAQTPPTFLVAADDDAAVFPENSVNFYLAMRKAGVPAELHIYKNGGHGFGLAPLDPVLSTWTMLLANWLRVNGYLATS